ncbi:MAG: hypothetical protein FJ161_05250, partial [Gammaproteobacteria bacterium]|nr:hypothetical protein [Gammaproteobacteria bacterium]
MDRAVNTSPKSPLFNILMNLCEEPHNKWTNNAVSTVISALNGNIFSMLALIPMYLSIRFFSKKDSPQFQLYAHLTRKNKTPSTYMDILKQLADPPGILSLVRIICKSDVLSLLKEIQKN